MRLLMVECNHDHRRYPKRHLVERGNKHPVDLGEQALERLGVEIAQEELERLGAPPKAPRVDFKYLRLLTNMPGNPFLHPEPPEDEPNSQSLAA